MRASFLALCLVFCAAAAVGCSSGPACAIDTDCPLGNRCGSDGACHVIGERIDSGPSTTDSGPRDAAASDARPTDGAAGDALVSDATASDAPVVTDAPAAEDAP